MGQGKEGRKEEKRLRMEYRRLSLWRKHCTFFGVKEVSAESVTKAVLKCYQLPISTANRGTPLTGMRWVHLCSCDLKNNSRSLVSVLMAQTPKGKAVGMGTAKSLSVSSTDCG